MEKPTRFWTITRTLIWIGVAAGVLALFGLGFFRPVERWLFEARVTWSGYDGCLCRDCRWVLFGFTDPHDLVLLGFVLPGNRPILGLVSTAIAFGCWFAAGSIWMRNWQAGRALKEHCCAACGYDLRGLRQGAVCPECGQ